MASSTVAFWITWLKSTIGAMTAYTIYLLNGAPPQGRSGRDLCASCDLRSLGTD